MVGPTGMCSTGSLRAQQRGSLSSGLCPPCSGSQSGWLGSLQVGKANPCLALQQPASTEAQADRADWAQHWFFTMQHIRDQAAATCGCPYTASLQAAPPPSRPGCPSPCRPPQAFALSPCLQALGPGHIAGLLHVPQGGWHKLSSALSCFTWAGEGAWQHGRS